MKDRHLFVVLSLCYGGLIACTTSCDVAGTSPQHEDDYSFSKITDVTVWANDVNMPQTRTDFELGETGIIFSWAEGDRIGIMPQSSEAESQVALTIRSGAGQKSARFAGGGWALRSDMNYAAYYPYTDDVDGLNKTVTFSYIGQKQYGDASMNHLGAYDFMATLGTEAVDEELSFNFDHLNAFIQFRLTVPAVATFSTLTLRCNEEIIPTVATLQLTSSDYIFTPMELANTLQLSLDNVQSTSENKQMIFYMNLPPFDMQGHTVYVILRSTDNRIYQGTILPRELKSGYAYRFDATLVDVTTSTDIDAPPFGNESIK